MWTHANPVALVVDDEAFARLFAVQVLLDQRFVVLEAASADEALEILRDNEDVAIVITDVCMPGRMNGLDFAQHVATSHPGVPLILTSGRVSPLELPRLKDRYLAKPYTAAALLRTVEELTSVEIDSGAPPLTTLMLAVG